MNSKPVITRRQINNNDCYYCKMKLYSITDVDTFEQAENLYNEQYFGPHDRRLYEKMNQELRGVFALSDQELINGRVNTKINYNNITRGEAVILNMLKIYGFNIDLCSVLSRDILQSMLNDSNDKISPGVRSIILNGISSLRFEDFEKMSIEDILQLGSKLKEWKDSLRFVQYLSRRERIFEPCIITFDQFTDKYLEVNNDKQVAYYVHNGNPLAIDRVKSTNSYKNINVISSCTTVSMFNRLLQVYFEKENSNTIKYEDRFVFVYGALSTGVDDIYNRLIEVDSDVIKVPYLDSPDHQYRKKILEAAIKCSADVIDKVFFTFYNNSRDNDGYFKLICYKKDIALLEHMTNKYLKNVTDDEISYSLHRVEDYDYVVGILSKISPTNWSKSLEYLCPNDECDNKQSLYDVDIAKWIIENRISDTSNVNWKPILVKMINLGCVELLEYYSSFVNLDTIDLIKSKLFFASYTGNYENISVCKMKWVISNIKNVNILSLLKIVAKNIDDNPQLFNEIFGDKLTLYLNDNYLQQMIDEAFRVGNFKTLWFLDSLR